VAITADDANEVPAVVVVTRPAGTNIRWHAVVQTSEVGY
jgi:hypothetical protein